jgi:uncharacterized protein (DUF983 family)
VREARVRPLSRTPAGARLKRRLLAAGLTPWPVCPRCGEGYDPTGMGHVRHRERCRETPPDVREHAEGGENGPPPAA